SGDPRPTQVLAEEGGDAPPIMVAGQKVRWVVDGMRGSEFQGLTIASYSVDTATDLVEITMREAGVGEEGCDLVELKSDMIALGEQDRNMRVRIVQAPVRRVLFDTGTVEGYGWSCFTGRDSEPPAGPVRALTNEHLQVVVDPADGTFAITTVDGLRAAGLGQLVDGGDGGDTYNYSPPDADIVIDRPDRASVTTLEDGPGRARWLIEAHHTPPATAPGDLRACTHRSHEPVTVPVRTTLEVRAGEPFLRVTHDIDNQASDHRLRAHFPLPARVTGSDAE